MTSPRRTSLKSMSKSGIEILSGFKKRSNSKSNSRGSILVILSAKATIEPAPEPRPGPTAIALSFAQLIKSATIKK